MKRAFAITSRILLWSILVLLLLVVAVVLLIRLPSVQNYITQKAVTYVSSKTHTRVELKRVYIGFPKTVVIEGLFAEDLNHDTLVSLRKLEVDIDMFALLKQKVTVSSLYLEGVNANIERNAVDSTYNFNFLVAAFTSGEKKPKEEKPKTDTTGGWQIDVNKVVLKDVRGAYVDELGGTDIRGHVGDLMLKVKGIDLKTMSFNANELILADSRMDMVINNRSVKESVDSVRAVLPSLALTKLTLRNVHFSMSQPVSGLRIAVDAGNLVAEPEEIDLNKQLIRVKTLQMDSTTTALELRRDEDKDTTGKHKDGKKIEDPGWRVDAGELHLKEVAFRLDMTNVPRQVSGVDYSHLNLQHVTTDITNASYSPERIFADIQKLALKEQSGFVLNNLTAHAEFDDNHAELKNMLLVTPHTRISNHLAIRYKSLNTLGKDIGAMGLEADLRNTRVSVDDILKFAPMLKDQPFFSGPAGKTLLVNGSIKGKLEDVTFNNLSVQGAGETYIAMSGHIKGLPDAKNAYYDVNLQKLSTTKKDLQELIGDKIPKSINVPDKIDLTADVKGTFKDVAAKFDLKTSEGDAAGEASFKMLNGDTQYVANISTRALDIGYLLKNDSLLGPVTAKLKLNGQNLSLSTLKADVSGEIESVTLKGYDYKNIVLDAHADGKTYKADVTIKDKNLAMDLKADVSLLPDQESYKIDLNLEGADLKELNILKEDLRISGKLNTDVQGTISDPRGQASLHDVVLIKGDQAYRIGSVAALSVNDKKRSAIKVNSGIINADYEGSIKIGGVIKAITNHINRYFRIGEEREVKLDTSEQDFTLRVSVSPHPVINGILLPDLEKFNGADISVGFNSSKQQLDVEVDVTGLEYKGNQLDNVSVEVHSDEKELKYDIAFDRFKKGIINLSETALGGRIQGDSLEFALKVYDKDSADKLQMAGILVQDTPKQYTLRLDNKNLVFANQNWEVPEDNYVHFGSAGFYVHRLDMSSKEQVLSVNSERDDAASPIKAEFKQFELGTFSQIIEKDTGVVRGVLNGTAELRNMQGAPAFLSDLKMTNVAFMQNPIGDIEVKADNLTANRYSAQVIISGADNDVKVNGYYAAAGDENQLNFKADINRLQVKSVEGFTLGQVRNTSGYITGNVAITGPASQPVINGEMRFKDVSANVAYLNSQMRLKDESISIDGKGVYLRSFRVEDEKGQTAIIDGKVLTSDFKKMQFDMTVNTSRFNVMNTSQADNPLYFGHVVLTSKISIKGDESLPVIRVTAELLGGSAFTFVVPSSKISVDRGEGVVVLIDTVTANDGNSIMNKPDTIPVALAAFKGIDLTANVIVTKETSFKVVLDKIYGDSLVVKGDGRLSFAMDETGQQSLVGTYTLSDGSYRAPLLGLAPKEFRIRNGSTITWNGRPTDATVNITAMYNSRTSPADLLASDLAGSTAAERNVYRKLLNFVVLLNMKGALLKPDISFQLDMDDQDKNAFGGAVYAKINSLNADPNELNKQVFSLLVLNGFAPSGSGGGADANTAATNLARNSVNQVLSTQLNNLTGRYIKGVDINFGMQTNDDYTATGVQAQTEYSIGVKKEFFGSRLSVQIGTSINVNDQTGALAQNYGGNNIPGDFIVEYKITEDGRYRLKAFRQNQFENLIDGLLYKTGVGIVYTRDYDTFKQLLHKPLEEKLAEEERKREKKEKKAMKKNQNKE